MTEVNFYPMDLETFRVWLQEGKAQGGIAGTACRSEHCPLANFLQANFGGCWLVCPSEYERLDYDLLHEIDEKHPLPAWAQAFVSHVDLFAGRGGAAISYADALVALHFVLAAHPEWQGG